MNHPPGAALQELPQCPIGRIDRADWEVIVVGAGPAGAIAAAALAGAGRSVLLLDRRQFPRDKTCGGLMVRDATDCLRRAGIHDEVLATGYVARATTVYSPSRISFTVPQNYLTIKRVVLDAILVRHAIRAGACFARGTVAAVRPQADGSAEVQLAETATRPRGRYVLLATGADIALGRALGMVTSPPASGIAVRRFVTAPAGPDDLILSFDRALLPGYAWIFPLGNNEYNIGCGIVYRQRPRETINLEKMFDRFIREFPPARELMAQGTFSSPLRGARLRCGLAGSEFHGPGNILAIGECVAATFPFTGEGIGKAMQTGEIAAQVVAAALAAGRPDMLGDYTTRINAELRPKYHGYRLAQNWLARPWRNDFAAHRIRRSRHLREVFVKVLNEEMDPERIFSWSGLLASYFH